MSGRRVFAAFLLALLCSGLLTWMMGKRLSKPSTVVEATQMRRIIVVSKDMEAGEVLDGAHLEMRDWPKSQVLTGAFEKPQEVVGRVLLFPMSSGEPVLTHDLAAPNAGTGLTARIPEGMRAISIRADSAANVSGFVVPGSLVDILVSYHTNAEPGFASEIVLQKVRVLAVGQRREPGSAPEPNSSDAVTLLVTPLDAVKLAQASSIGKILLDLRNGTDQGIPSVATASSSASVGPLHEHISGAVPGVTSTRPKAPALAFTVETIAGDKETMQTFVGGKQ